MSFRTITNLRLLQIIDAGILVSLLLILALVSWIALGDLEGKSRQNLIEAKSTLQQAQKSFLKQLDLEATIDQHRETFAKLNEEFFRFAFNPDSTPGNLQTLQSLGATLQTQRQQILDGWPQSSATELRERYEENSGILLLLIEEVDGLSPGHWRQLAADARDSMVEAREVLEKMEEMGSTINLNISEAISLSLKESARNSLELEERLMAIKQRGMLAMLAIVAFMLVSRAYFSARFSHITQAAQAAQKVAEDAMQTKARFLATMSHEIRTPMNGVIGMTRLLMNTPMSKKQTEFVDSIHLSGEHLLTVINDVLDFSKIEAGKLDLKREPFELRACIEEILNLLNAKALEKNLELAYAVDPRIPLFIEGDMVRLRQVLTNLIGNAIKFTDRGEITIFVIPHSQISEELELEFQINDTGSGIPQHRLESIFEQFSRADESHTRNYEGTGLGLTISRHLVEMMGGAIWAKSTIGVGSRFYFTIKTRQTEGKLKPFLHNNIPEIIGNRILIVENNPASSQSMRDICQSWGAHVDLTGSSADAISRIAVGRPYDIALVDSNLPDDTALTLAKYIRQRFSKQELPLVLIAPPNDRHPKELVRELYNLYLTKPITRSRLFDSLMTVLGELNLVTVRSEQSTLKLGERLPLTILLAEDNPINQVVASSILDEMAYKIDIVENGREAIAALHKKKYDVIFMDMQMPEMDGLEATLHIRANFPPAYQPVIIAMTANAMEGDKQHCLNAGMNHYISKPVLPEAVEAALIHWCKPKTIPSQSLTEEASHAIADN